VGNEEKGQQETGTSINGVSMTWILQDKNNNEYNSRKKLNVSNTVCETECGKDTAIFKFRKLDIGLIRHLSLSLQRERK
jgi:hypothetical protein